MPTQPRELKKNYIGILCDRTEEQRVVDSLAKSDRFMKEYLLGLIAAALNRNANTR